MRTSPIDGSTTIRYPRPFSSDTHTCPPVEPPCGKKAIAPRSSSRSGPRSRTTDVSVTPTGRGRTRACRSLACHGCSGFSAVATCSTPPSLLTTQSGPRSQYAFARRSSTTSNTVWLVMACVLANRQRAARSLAAALSRSCPNERVKTGATSAVARASMKRTAISSRRVNPAARDGPGFRVWRFGCGVSGVGATCRVAPIRNPELETRNSTPLLIVLFNPLRPPLDSLPAYDVLVLSVPASHAVSAIREHVIVPVLPRGLIDIRVSPRIEWDLLFLQIGTVPVLDPAGIDKQGLEAFIRGRIPADVEPKVVQGGAKQLDLRLGRGLFSLAHPAK